MKLSTQGPAHLTYCTNIHPGERWSEVFNNLKTHTVELKRRICPDRPFGIGLRLSNIASLELAGEGSGASPSPTLLAFKHWLQTQELYVFTLNGFPYGGFHDQIVKDKVYSPDWTQQARLDYTLRLCRILATLLPAGMEGGISTLPLSYKPWHSKPLENADPQAQIENLEQIYEKSTAHIVRVVIETIRISQQTGSVLHLDLEPEPDGLIENAAELVSFFEDWLIPLGSHLLKEQGFSAPEQLLRQHVQVCYDTCHFAVEYENPAAAIAQLRRADIKIGKLQLSAAIKVQLPAVSERHQREEVRSHLLPFAESTYLHQVIERYADGHLQRYRDLAVALPHLAQTTAQEWRTHFHVPIFLTTYQALTSTQDHLTEILSLLSDTGCQHLEIETYTWDVLPEELSLDVLSAIEREYRWVLETLSV